LAILLVTEPLIAEQGDPFGVAGTLISNISLLFLLHNFVFGARRWAQPFPKNGNPIRRAPNGVSGTSAGRHLGKPTGDALIPYVILFVILLR
jgi:hypothetical protein